MDKFIRNIDHESLVRLAEPGFRSVGTGGQQDTGAEQGGQHYAVRV